MRRGRRIRVELVGSVVPVHEVVLGCMSRGGRSIDELIAED